MPFYWILKINGVRVQNVRGFKESVTDRRVFVKNPADCIYSRTQLLQIKTLDLFWSAPLLADDTPRFFGRGESPQFRILKRSVCRSWNSQCNYRYLACRFFCVKIILNSKVYFCTRVSLTLSSSLVCLDHAGGRLIKAWASKLLCSNLTSMELPSGLRGRNANNSPRNASKVIFTYPPTGYADRTSFSGREASFPTEPDDGTCQTAAAR